MTPNRPPRCAPAICSAAIWHGPGHQTKTKCDVIGPHRIHHAIYGRYDQEAFWGRKKKAFSGYFDEPPNDG